MNRRECLMSALGAVTAAGAPGWAGSAARAQTANPRAASRLRDSTLVVDGLDPSALTEDYLGMLEAAGVDCWHQSMGGFASFANLLRFCDAHAGRIVQAGSVAEIRRAHAEGKVAHLSGWQSAEVLIDEGSSTLPQIGHLRAYRELGLRICGLVYNAANAFGGGALDPAVGLTRAGRRLVEEIHAQKIVLDVGGHTGEQTSFDAIGMSRGVPVICSHTNLRALVDNPRNMTDRLIERIAATGGVIGLTSFNDFHARSVADAATPVTPQVGLERHLDQYDYMKRLVGVDHIGLGPDFMYGRTDLDRMIRELWPADTYSDMPWHMVRGFETISDLPNVTQGLMQRGWSAAEIRKVLGENWLRVYGRVWGG